MITLYHSPFTRSLLIRFALEELEIPHEIVWVDASRGEHKQAAYLQVNPLGQLPALRDGELIIREAAAIALHLADKAESKGLAPKVGTLERASYYQWVVFYSPPSCSRCPKSPCTPAFCPSLSASRPLPPTDTRSGPSSRGSSRPAYGEKGTSWATPSR